MMSKDQCKMAKMQCEISQVDAPSVQNASYFSAKKYHQVAPTVEWLRLIKVDFENQLSIL